MKGGCRWLFCLLSVFYLGASAQTLQELSEADLPLLDIVTVDGLVPPCEVAYAPEGCLGVTIVNNSYVPGRMVMTLHGDTLYDSGPYEKSTSGMRIKRRGNSTGAYLDQHPYKLKLSKKYDLLMRDDSRLRHKEWLLLSMYTWNIKMANAESNLLFMMGNIVSRLFGVEWVPDYTFVNVRLNGDYQGLYYLAEAVAHGKGRIDVADTGFIIEHDAFWWKEDVFFKTDAQPQAFGFTYKYPDDDDVTDSIQTVISSFMNLAETAVFGGDNDVADYLDLESFARWILVHDLLGSSDAAGCNRFLYKYDLEEANALSSKLKMGPLWDFDSSFLSDSYSTLHDLESFYFPSLFQHTAFLEHYVALWKQERATLDCDLQRAFSEAASRFEKPFNESMLLHKQVFPGEGKNDFASQVEEIQKKLGLRILLVDGIVEQLDNVIALGLPQSQADVRLVSVCDFSGVSYQVSQQVALPHGFYIFTYSNGMRRKVRR